MPMIDPQKLASLAAEWDPTPFMEALNQPGAGGAMDMSGSAASPLGPQPQAGMGYGSIFADAPQGAAPGGAPIPAAGMQQLMGMMHPQQPKIQAPPPVMPRQGPPIQRVPMPQIDRIPTLAQILKGKM